MLINTFFFMGLCFFFFLSLLVCLFLQNLHFCLPVPTAFPLSDAGTVGSVEEARFSIGSLSTLMILPSLLEFP
ncbi:unnamed protein product, partial [Vitis vinifera]|uniref:Uncharacterized protein n=1 Tax=Vitis vinifera TaxID=29760 RepID=D7T9Q6_VITVI